jgi:hypothetical protein
MKRLSAIGSVDQAAFQLRADVTVSQRQYPFFGDDHNVLRGWKPGFVQPKKLTQKTLDPVSLYGIPHFLADRHAHSPDARRVRAEDDRESLRMAPHPLIVDPLVILPLPDPLLLAKGVGYHGVPSPSGRLPDLPPARPWDQTVSFFLPFARLRLRTARPPFVAMRTRNPWVRFFFVLLKFVNVFFIV